MTITDIAEREAEERKREKRLSHLANAITNKFIDSIKPKTKSDRTFVDFFTRSFLDYIFFYQHKEIQELNEKIVRQFMLEYAVQKLSITKEKGKETSELLTLFIDFLKDDGYIKNSIQIKKEIEQNLKEFNKLLPAKKAQPKNNIKPTTVKSEKAEEIKVGRNDPCPCGSGKKYKKCCGKNK